MLVEIPIIKSPTHVGLFYGITIVLLPFMLLSFTLNLNSLFPCYFEMATLVSAERPVVSYIPRIYQRGARARAIIQDWREKYGIRDAIHGLLPDTRPLPSAWEMGIVLEMNKVERRLQFLFERKVSRLHHA